MLWNPLTIILLLILFLLLLLIWLYAKNAKQPWELYNSFGDPEKTTIVPCGDGGTLVSVNAVANLNVHVEIQNLDRCAVEISIGGNVFLTARGATPGIDKPYPTYVAAFVPLPKGLGIEYKCKSDEEEGAECVFRARITAR